MFPVKTMTGTDPWSTLVQKMMVGEKKRGGREELCIQLMLHPFFLVSYLEPRALHFLASEQIRKSKLVDPILCELITSLNIT